MRRGSISNNIIAFLILISIAFYLRGGQATAQPPTQPPGLDIAGLDIAIAVQEEHTPELLGKPEVVGTAVGLDDEGQPIIQVFARSSRFRGIPNNIEGFPVEVLITGQFVALGKCVDRDRDGFPKQTGGCQSAAYDCNDGDGTINPNSIEVCDSIDNNCNFLVDEGAVCGPPPPTPPPPTPPPPTPPPPTPPPSASDCNTTDKCPRPIPIGVSLGNEWLWCSAGTYGFRAKMGTDVVGVSNNHVLAMDLNGNPISIGDWIFQPGLAELFNCIDFPVTNKVGELAAYVPIQFCSCSDLGSCPANSNFVDAAIFDTTSTDLIGNATPSNGYGMPKSTYISPAGALAAGGNVKKYGRTTELTTGKISGINATVYVQYTSSDCARFDGQIMIGPGGFSAGGDSGSLIVMRGGPEDRMPVGLLYAGSPSVTVANPIGEVLAAFGMTVDGE